MADPKFMSILVVVMVSSESMKRSGMSYGKKILTSLLVVFFLSIFYYNNFPKEKTNLFFPLSIFLIILFLISHEREGREQAKEFFKNFINRIKGKSRDE